MSKINFKVEIQLDEEKIIEVGEFKPESIYEAIRANFAQFDLPELPTEDGSMVFCDKGRNRDMAALGSIVVDLYDAEWFKPYAKKFLWYEKNSNNNSFDVQNVFDVLNNFKVKRL